MTEQYLQRDINDGDPNLGSLREEFKFFDEFLGAYAFTGPGPFSGVGEQNWRATITGGATIASLLITPPSSVNIANQIGQAILSLTAVPGDAINLLQSQVSMAGLRFQAMVNLVDVGAPAVDEFSFLVAIAGIIVGGALVDGFGFRYDVTPAGVTNWVIQTNNIGGGEGTTVVDTGIPVTADTWFSLGAQLSGADPVDGDLSECNFFINGSSAGAITTNLPTAPALFGNGFPQIVSDRLAGVATAPLVSLVDYFYMQKIIAR